jgi:hypothetical protein
MATYLAGDVKAWHKSTAAVVCRFCRELTRIMSARRRLSLELDVIAQGMYLPDASVIPDKLRFFTILI